MDATIPFSWIPPATPYRLARTRRSGWRTPKKRRTLCDKFTSLALIDGGLNETELLTTPTLLAAFVDRGVLTTAEARVQLTDIADSRSWQHNSYYQRVKRTFDREN